MVTSAAAAVVVVAAAVVVAAITIDDDADGLSSETCLMILPVALVNTVRSFVHNDVLHS